MDIETEQSEETQKERPVDKSDSDSTDSKAAENTSGPLRTLISSWRDSRAAAAAGLAILAVMLLGGLGVWLLFPAEKPGQSDKQAESPIPRDNRAEAQGRLVKQDLPPFYIPLPQSGNGQMARVSLAVTWDRPSSSRFRDQEYRIRDRLYRGLTKLAAEGENMRSMSLTIRAEAQKILEELLHPDELRVVVSGVFIV